MIEFIESTHEYLVDGILVPSCTAILKKTIFKDKYKDIPPFVLEKAATFGKNVHKAIETKEWIELDDTEYLVYENYLNLAKDKKIEPYTNEQIVHYGLSYAGTFDMEAKVNDEDALVDIKTTYNLDKEYLSWQLSMYEMAKGKQYDKLYAVWLPKRKGAELVEIKRKSQEEIMELIKQYEQTISEEDL